MSDPRLQIFGRCLRISAFLVSILLLVPILSGLAVGYILAYLLPNPLAIVFGVATGLILFFAVILYCIRDNSDIQLIIRRVMEG